MPEIRLNTATPKLHKWLKGKAKQEGRTVPKQLEKMLTDMMAKEASPVTPSNPLIMGKKL